MPRYVNKAFVIGLGGTGKYVLTHLKRKLFDAGIDLDEADYRFLELLSIDFDPKTVQATSIRTRKTIELESANNEILVLDSDRIVTRIEHMDNPQSELYYKGWYPDWEGKVISYGQAVAGAAQWRPLGRTGFFEWSEQITNVLERKMRNLQQYQMATDFVCHSDDILIFIVSSMGGGSGAGIFLDTAYYLRKIAPDITANPIYGFLLLPGIYDQYDVNGRLYANSYALLKELRMLIDQRADFIAKYPNRESLYFPQKKRPAFNTVFLVSHQIDANLKEFRVDSMAELIAETIFTDVCSELWASRASALTNLTQEYSKKGVEEFDKSCVFSLTGSCSILFPTEEELIEYARNRFACEVFPVSQSLDTHIEASLLNALEQEEVLNTPLEHCMAARLNVENATLPWNEEDQEQLAERLDVECENFRRNADAMQGALDDWLNRFISVDHSISISLPNESADFTSLQTDLTNRINTLLNSADSLFEREFLLNEILNRLNHVIEESRRQAEHLSQRANQYRQNNPDDMVQIHEDIQELTDETQFFPDAVWRRLFLNFIAEAADFYTPDVKRMRTYLKLMRTIESVRDETINPRLEELQQVKQNLAQIDNEFDGDLDAFVRESLRPQGEIFRRTENSICTEDYLNSLWEYVQENLNYDRSLLSLFEDFVDERLSRQNGISEARDAEKQGDFKGYIQNFAEQEIDQLISQGVSLEPLRFVDEDMLAALLKNAKNDYVLTNIRPNQNQEQVVYALIPTSSERFEGQLDVKNLFSGALASAFPGTDVEKVFSADSNRMYAKYFCLYNPAVNLRGIDQYRQNYEIFGDNKKMFHIHRSYINFPDVPVELPDEEKYVMCGNPECTHDITNLNRREIFCPGCEKIIKSRCGNPDCPDNDIDEKISNPPPRTCPVCKGTLRTSWWFCDRDREYISTKNEGCPSCIVAHKRGEIKKEDIRTIHGQIKRQECWGCLHEKIEKPYEIDFLYLLDEVREDEDDEALDVYHSVLSDGLCPECRSTLLPVCPYLEDVQTPHFVRKIEGVFVCTAEHFSEDIFECGVCGFPLKPDAEYCLRCLTELKRCNYCGETSLKLIDNALTICPDCKLDPDEQPKPGPPPPEPPIERTKMCPNLEERCLIAVNEKLLPKDLETCPACKKPLTERSDAATSE